MAEPESAGRPPRDDLVRAIFGGDEPAIEVREADGERPVMAGHFAVFDEWTEINSVYEGQFMERIAPGAFAKTFEADRGSIRVTFNHGKDPSLGDKVLGTISELGEDNRGAHYAVPLFDGIDPLLISGLRAGAYGSSFRFRVTREDFKKQPTRDDAGQLPAWNPKGLPERTIRQAQVMEFGPVTFPAYAAATAGIRSLTDQYQFGRLMEHPDLLRALAGQAPETEALPPEEPVPTSPETAAPVLPEEPSRQTPPEKSKETAPVADNTFYRTREEMYAREHELQANLSSLANEYPGTMPADRQAEFDTQSDQLRDLRAQIVAAEARAEIVKQADLKGEVEVTTRPWTPPAVRQNKQDDVLIRDMYDFGEIRAKSRNPEHENELLRSSALRAIDGAELVHTKYATRTECGDALNDLIRGDVDGDISRRILSTGSPTYRRFFNKMLAGQPGTAEELRYGAMTGLGATTTTGGYATVYELDPTIMPTSNGAVNPYRAISRVIKTTANEWRGVTSAGTVATMVGEASAAIEGGPVLAQPAAIVQKAQGFVTYSIEAGEDIANLDSQLGEMFVDAKDLLEAQKFTTGAGTTVFPQGIVIGAAASTTSSATTTVLAAADLYALEAALPARFRPNAVWLMNRYVTNKVRAIDTAGGAQLYTENIRVGLGNSTGPSTPLAYQLLGYPVAECSEMVASLAQNGLIMVLGDFSRYFVIIDKVGLNVEPVPLMFDATTSYPTGQRGLYFYWRYTSKVLSASAFQILKGA